MSGETGGGVQGDVTGIGPQHLPQSPAKYGNTRENCRNVKNGYHKLAIMQNRVCTPFFTPFSDLTSKSECCGTPFLSNNNRVLTPFFTPFF